MTTTTASEIVISNLDRLVRRERDRTEGWKQEHELAMGCLDLESFISTALFAYKKVFRSISSYLRNPQPAGQSRERFSQAIHAFFRLWLEWSEKLETYAREFEQLGYEVDLSEPLREAIQYVKQTISPENPTAPWGVFPAIDWAEVEQADQNFEANGRKGIPAAEVLERIREARKQASG